MFMGPRNWFQGMDYASLCSLAGRYDNPIPRRFLAPIDFLKIPALVFYCSMWNWETQNKNFEQGEKKEYTPFLPESKYKLSIRGLAQLVDEKSN